jgi:Mn-dependent DtxR family transcriptional regulator
MPMKKIATYIAEQQHARLKALATRLGVTQAELLRRFLEAGLVRAERTSAPRPPPA